MNLLIILAWLAAGILIFRWMTASSLKRDRVAPSPFAEEQVQLQSSTDGHAEPPPMTSEEVEQLEKVLLESESREEVARAALRLSRRRAERTAILLYRNGFIEGYRGMGPGLEKDPMQLKALLMPVAQDSVASEPVFRGISFSGQPRNNRVDQAMLRALHHEAGKAIALFPVKIGNRVVALLYIESGEGRFDTGTLAASGELADRLGEAYKRIIVARKKRQHERAKEKGIELAQSSPDYHTDAEADAMWDDPSTMAGMAFAAAAAPRDSRPKLPAVPLTEADREKEEVFDDLESMPAPDKAAGGA